MAAAGTPARKLGSTGLEKPLAYANGHTPLPKAASFRILQLGILDISHLIPSMGRVAELGQMSVPSRRGSHEREPIKTPGKRIQYVHNAIGDVCERVSLGS